MSISSVWKIKCYEQSAEPTLDLYEKYAFWKDTDDNKVYIIYRRGASDQVKVELT